MPATPPIRIPAQPRALIVTGGRVLGFHQITSPRPAVFDLDASRFHKDASA